MDGILKQAVGSREAPASPWTGVLYVFLAILGIALAALPVILARRKAAKLAHKIDLLEEEEKQAKVKAADQNFEDQARLPPEERRSRKEAVLLNEKLVDAGLPSEEDARFDGVG